MTDRGGIAPDLFAHVAPAEDPVPENHLPCPHRAYQHPDHNNQNPQLQSQSQPQIIPAPWQQQAGDIFIPPDIFVVGDFNTSEEPSQAYARIPGKEPIDIAHAHRLPGWGKIFFCQVYDRVGPQTFQATEVPQYVAVKRLNKDAVHIYLHAGGQENPYVEVSRMREFGDNEHVLSCIEFLQDNTWLYIVTPMAAGRDRTLKEAISWNDADELMEPARIRQIFDKLLQILAYFKEKGICHRDLSPDNILFLTDDNLVAFDLAMSIRVPIDSNGQRSLIRSQGRVGTLAFMAPEVYDRGDFDGFAIDLWAAGLILYSLLTNCLLYEKPRDQSYQFFVAARNLSSNPINPMVITMIYEAAAPTLLRWINQARTHTMLSEGTILFLEKLLAEEPGNRYNLEEAYDERVRLGDELGRRLGHEVP